MNRTLPALLLAGLLAAACGGGDPVVDGGSESPADGVSASLTAIDTLVEASLAGAEFAEISGEASMAQGDQARTDPVGFGQVVYPDGSVTRLSGGTEFTLVQLSSVQDSQVADARLDLGRAYSRVKAVTGSEGRFEVETSVANATVRGTAFDVDCTDGCVFSVLEGSVEVAPPAGDPVEVPAGRAAEVAADGTVGPLLLLATPLDPWLVDNLARDEAAGFPSLAAPVDAAASPAIGGTWTVTFTVTASNDPQSPPGAQNTVDWEVTMSCPSGACDGTITTEDVPVAAFTFADGIYTIDEQGDQTNQTCLDAGVTAWDRESTGSLQATHADVDDPAQGVRFVGTLTEILTPRPAAVDAGCVDDVVLTRDTTLSARLQ